MPSVALLAALASLGTGCAPEPGCLECGLGDANNYALSSELEAEVFVLQAQSDAVLDWSGLTRDVQGKEMRPEDVDQVLLVAFLALSPEEIAEGLARDTLNQRDATLFVSCSPEGASSCALSEFSVLGSSLDVAEVFLSDQATWLVAFTTTGGLGARSFAFLEASDQSSAQRADIDNDTASLRVEVDLLSLEPLLVAPTPELHLDWSGVETDGLGRRLDAASLDQLQLARYAQSPEELQARIFELESLALERWTLELCGESSAWLTDLQGPVPFAGVDDEGTWLLALTCSGCTHPAPRIITLLEPGALPEEAP